jgi:hypothetical protein
VVYRLIGDKTIGKPGLGHCIEVPRLKTGDKGFDALWVKIISLAQRKA